MRIYKLSNSKIAIVSQRNNQGIIFNENFVILNFDLSLKCCKRWEILGQWRLKLLAVERGIYSTTVFGKYQLFLQHKYVLNLRNYAPLTVLTSDSETFSSAQKQIHSFKVFQIILSTTFSVIQLN